MLRKKIEQIKLKFPNLYNYLQNEMPDLISEPTDDKINVYTAYIAFYFGSQAFENPETSEQQIQYLNELMIQE